MGSLVCGLLVPACLDAEPIVKALDYGAVCVNTLTYMAYTVMALGGVWGAHPSDTQRRSGTGYIGNAYRLAGVAKGVTYGPPLAKASSQPAQLPPPIVFDTLHAAIVVSTSKASAALNITALLTRRLLAFVARCTFLPRLVGIVLGSTSTRPAPLYGACM